MKSYPFGDSLNFATTFFDRATGAVANPSTVTLTLSPPEGELIVVDHVNPSTGVFTGVFVPEMSGIWSYRWLGTGSVQAASEGKFEIRPSIFASGE